MKIDTADYSRPTMKRPFCETKTESNRNDLVTDSMGVGTVNEVTMTLEDGFPIGFEKNIAAGGVLLKRIDVNTVFYHITRHLMSDQYGRQQVWNSELCKKIGGYPKGALLWMQGMISNEQGSTVLRTFPIMSAKDDNLDEPILGQTIGSVSENGKSWWMPVLDAWNNQTILGKKNFYQTPTIADTENQTGNDAVNLNVLCNHGYEKMLSNGNNASRALFLDANKQISTSSTTDIELSRLHGIKSNVQTQLNNCVHKEAYGTEKLPAVLAPSSGYRPEGVEFINGLKVFGIDKDDGHDGNSIEIPMCATSPAKMEREEDEPPLYAKQIVNVDWVRNNVSGLSLPGYILHTFADENDSYTAPEDGWLIGNINGCTVTISGSISLKFMDYLPDNLTAVYIPLKQGCNISISIESSLAIDKRYKGFHTLFNGSEGLSHTEFSLSLAYYSMSRGSQY